MMEKRSRIDQLIQELCPNGVEYRIITDIFTLRNGYTPSKRKEEYWREGNIPWFRMDDIRQNGHILSNSIQHISIKAIKGQLFPASSIIIATTATIGEHALIQVPFLANQRFTCLFLKKEYSNEINIKFMFYYFFIIGDWCKQNTNTSGFQSVNMELFKKLHIPVPPLPVQEEIVRILDSFTELEAELEARKKQYDYYKNQLLNFEGQTDIEWKPLGEVGTFTRGASPRPIQKYITSKIIGINWIKIGDVEANNKYVEHTNEKITIEGAKKSKFLKIGSLILSNSMSFGRPYILKINGCIHDGWIAIQNFENYFSADFLYYLLRSSDIQKDWKKRASSGTVQNLNIDIVKKTRIPVPSMEEQKRIVSILDQFDTLVNDISKGLPAEIEARRRQYEYYRDRLLTFKEMHHD